MRLNLAMQLSQIFLSVLKNGKIGVLGLFYFLLFQNGMASSQIPYKVDVYGTHQLSAAILSQKFPHDFQSIANVMGSSTGMSNEKNQKIVLNAMEEITSYIKKTKKFAFVTLSPVMYPDKKTIYITVDVVDKGDEKRLSHFSPKPTGNIKDPHQLIKKWLEYQTLGLAIMYKDKPLQLFKTCPAHHCLFGFEYPELKKYKKIFTQQVPKNKIQLVDMLKHDQNESKRAAAAYLLAHIKSGKELVEILTPSVQDPSEQVRNNVMRVLAMTLSKTHYENYPMDQAVKALNYPTTTDRNKALFVVSSLINDPVYAKYISKHAGSTLLSTLKLYQPDNHDFAYGILQKISGKKFGERDYQSWEKWIKTQV